MTEARFTPPVKQHPRTRAGPEPLTSERHHQLDRRRQQDQQQQDGDGDGGAGPHRSNPFKVTGTVTPLVAGSPAPSGISGPSPSRGTSTISSPAVTSSRSAADDRASATVTRP